jgi:hypothetical protein
MGIGFVLLIWAVIGLVLACVGAVCLAGLSAYFTRGAQHGRKRLIVGAAAFPLACLGWIAVMFAFQALVNEGLLHRDPGLGDTWHCLLPNSYEILMIDTTDQGYVFNPKTQPDNTVADQNDAIGGIRTLQLAGRYILGGYSNNPYDHQDRTRVDSYFLLDTQIGEHAIFPSYEALRKSAEPLGIKLDLQPIASVYATYRFSWFEVVSGILTLLPPVVFAFFLCRAFLRVRRSRVIPSHPSS